MAASLWSTWPANTPGSIALGVPNMNVFTGISSVQGYGALDLDHLRRRDRHAPPGLGERLPPRQDGTFAQLRLGAIAISAANLMVTTVSESERAASLREPITANLSAKRYFGGSFAWESS